MLLKSAILVLFIATLPANSLNFHIVETERKCFIEEVPDETMVVGNYKVQLYDLNNNEYSDDANIGMHVEVKDPNGAIILNKMYMREGRFTFASHSPGQHLICIYSNSTSWFKGAQLRIRLDIQVGEYAQIQLNDKLQLQVGQLLEQITKEQSKASTEHSWNQIFSQFTSAVFSSFIGSIFGQIFAMCFGLGTTLGYKKEGNDN